MSVNYYFFDSKIVEGKHDRVYSAGDFAKYLDGLVGSGVFPIPSTSLQVYAGTGMNILVRPGMGWINGHKLINDADMTLSIDPADVTLNRIDRVVFRVNMTNRLMEIAVKKGAKASSPKAPDVLRTQDFMEYSLATITINKQTTKISESMIRDTRLDSSVCGVVQGLIQQVATDTLYKQWNAAYDEAIAADQADFDEWFMNVKDTLATSTLIKTYKKTVISPDSTTTMLIPIDKYVKELDILEIYINGLRLDANEYTVEPNGKNVTFLHEIDANAPIEFVVYKTIDGSGAETVIKQVEEVVDQVDAFRNNMKSPELLFTGTYAAETIGAIRYLYISMLGQYDIIKVRVRLGTLGENIIDFYKGTAADNGRINQTVSCFKDPNTYACASLLYDATENTLGWRVDSVKGWAVNSMQILKVWGIEL